MKDTLFLEANNLVKSNNDVKFCFVNINCRLKIKWEDDLWPDSFITSLEDLKGKLQVNYCYSFFYWFLISVIFILLGARSFLI